MNNFGICDVLLQIGNENVSYQTLGNSMTGIKKNGDDSEVSFLTTEITPESISCGTKRVGIVVWFDSGDYADAVKNLKSK